MTHTPTPWHVDAYGCSKDYKLRLCEPMRSGFPLATIAQFQYNWRDAGQYDRQISYKEAEANARRAASCVNALEGFDIAAIEAGVVKQLVDAAMLWQSYDDMDEADFTAAGPMLHYAKAINATRAALALIAPSQELQEQG